MALSRLVARIRRPEQTPYLQDPGIHAELAPPAPQPPQPQPQRRPVRRPRTHDPEHNLPAYTPHAKPAQKGIHSLPTALLHRILLFSLDPKATPDRFAFDPDIERIHRRHTVFRQRAVDKRFFLLCTALLREHFTPIYHSLSQHPRVTLGTRERAVLDRFVALRIGQDLRDAESSLTEDTGEERDIFSRLQPAARIEDMLQDLPPHLVSLTASELVLLEFPLPHPLVSVKLTPTWVQIYFQRKVLVVEVRRGGIDQTVDNIEQGLEFVRSGVVAWGSKVA